MYAVWKWFLHINFQLMSFVTSSFITNIWDIYTHKYLDIMGTNLTGWDSTGSTGNDVYNGPVHKWLNKSVSNLFDTESMSPTAEYMNAFNLTLRHGKINCFIFLTKFNSLQQ